MSREKNKLKIRIESKSSNIPEERTTGRNSILYNLAKKDDIFEPIKVNLFKKNENFINLGTTIIPVVNTYKVPIEPGDILLFVSNGITDNMSDRDILLNFCITENFDENFNNLIEKAVEQNQERNVTAIALTAQPTEIPRRQFSNTSPNESNNPYGNMRPKRRYK